MRLIAQLIVAAMLLTGVSYAKGPKYKTNRNSYSDTNRWRDRDYRYPNYSRYGTPYSSYRNLPPGIQKKLYRGGTLPPGQARRLSRDRNWYRNNDSYYYNRYNDRYYRR